MAIARARAARGSAVAMLTTFATAAAIFSMAAVP
jgi:hypothetical protein